MSKSLPFRVGAYEALERLVPFEACRVFRARCVDEDRGGVRPGTEVALKIFNRVHERSEVCTRFERLAGILMTVKAPHLFRYLDAFKWKPEGSGRQCFPCLITDLPPGRSLAALLDDPDHRWTRPQQAALMRDILEGLRNAEHYRVLPRHLTPGQVYLGTDGSARLLGLGVPRVGEVTSATLGGDASLFPYYAPDFVRSDQHGDATSLLFSAGVLFYRVFTGYLPFSPYRDRRDKGDCFGGLVAAFQRRWRAEPAPEPEWDEALFADYPETRRFLAACLATERTDRLAALADASRALRPVSDELSPGWEASPAPPVAAQPRGALLLQPHIRPWLMAAASLAAVVLLVVGLSRLQFAPAPETMAPVAEAAAALPVVKPNLEPLQESDPLPATLTLEEPVESLAADTPPAPAGPPELYHGPATVELFVDKPGDEGPPVERSYRKNATETWQPTGKELELNPGDYQVRFRRADFESVVKPLHIAEGARGAYLASPRADQWKPLAGLAELRRAEAAAGSGNTEEVAAVFARPDRPSFEWPPYAKRFEELRKSWFTHLKRNTLAPRLGTVAFRVRMESPPEGQPPIQVYYRQEGGERWLPLTEQTLVQPGPYEMRFIRPDYKPMGKAVKVVSGKQSFEATGPRLASWVPGAQLQRLLDLEAALNRDDMTFLTEQLAHPQGRPFKSEVHAKRLAHVRQAWYQKLLHHE